MFKTDRHLKLGTSIHKSLWQVLVKKKKSDHRQKSVTPFSSSKWGTMYCCFSPMLSSLFNDQFFMWMLFLTLWLWAACRVRVPIPVGTFRC